MYLARPICADCGEEIMCLQAVCDVFKLFAVSGKEYGARSRSIANADDITLQELGTVGCAVERLVVSPLTVGDVGDRKLMPTCRTG
jgi:hypothetical protein